MQMQVLGEEEGGTRKKVDVVLRWCEAGSVAGREVGEPTKRLDQTVWNLDESTAVEESSGEKFFFWLWNGLECDQKRKETMSRCATMYGCM